MSLESAIYSVLTNEAAISALVGSRIYLQQRLIGTELPAITYEVRGNDPIRTLAGASGLSAADVVVTSIAETYAASRSLADATRDAFEGSHSQAGLVLEVRWSSEAPLEAVFDLGDENEPTRIEQTFTVHHRSA